MRIEFDGQYIKVKVHFPFLFACFSLLLLLLLLHHLPLFFFHFPTHFLSFSLIFPLPKHQIHPCDQNPSLLLHTVEPESKQGTPNLCFSLFLVLLVGHGFIPISSSIGSSSLFYSSLRLPF